jgi:hypothetical protein
MTMRIPMKMKSSTALLLVLLSFALCLAVASAAGPALAQAPAKPCADAIPADCKKVKYLGEDKGCACFACNPDTKQRKVVCTRNEDDKRTLLKLKDQPTPTPTPQASQ